MSGSIIDALIAAKTKLIECTNAKEPITVRLTTEQYEALKAEARARGLTAYKCDSKDSGQIAFAGMIIEIDDSADKSGVVV